MVEKATTAQLMQRIKSLQWHHIFNMMYMEPVIFLLVFAHALSGTIMRNQIIYQACVTVFNYNESVCEQLGTKNVTNKTNAIETEIQPYVADLFMMRTLLESIVPAFCGIFVGAWSDHYGRKPLLLTSMIGFSCTYLIAAVICEVALYYPLNPWYYILTAVPHSLLGGNCVFTVAAFCFVSDVTDMKARPYRMIALEAFIFIGLTSGSLLSATVYEATSATTTFVISGVLMCGATVFIAGWVPESLHMHKKEAVEAIPTVAVVSSCGGVDSVAVSCVDEVLPPPAVECEDDAKGKCNGVQITDVENTESKAKSPPIEVKNPKSAEPLSEQEKCEGHKKCEGQPGMFSFVHIKEMISCVVRERPHFDRSIIWLVTGTMFLAIFVLDGAMTVFYLFVREKFHWDIREFTFYETISHLLTMIGAVLGVVIMRKFLKLSIVTLALVSFISDVLSSVIRGFAVESWHLYLSIAVGLFRSVGAPMCRTIVSNIVPATELGKIFSIKNVLQSFAPFLASPVYTLIYKESLSTFPGLFNIVSAGLYAIAVVFLIIVLRFKMTAKEYYAKVLK